MASSSGFEMAGRVLRTRATGDPGSSQGGGSNSLSGMLSTLIPTGILAIAYVAAFLYLRQKKKRVYQPRTYLSTIADHEKTPKNSPGLFAWIGEWWRLPDTYVLTHHSLDGYLYLRFFKMLSIIAFVGACITWPVLFPVYATANSVNVKQFDYLQIGQVSNTPARNLAPTFMSWIFLGFVIFVVGRESLYFVSLRQKYLLSPYVASRLSTRTVLFTDVPEGYTEEAKLREILPGLKYVWNVSDTKELQDLVKERDKTAMKLEGAEVKMSKSANQRRIKGKDVPPQSDDPMRWVSEKMVPTHKLKPLIGEKVKTIDWCKSHLQELIPKVEDMQAQHWTGKGKNVNAVFVEFETVQAAEVAYQQVPWHLPKQFQARTIGSRPNEIIWSNLNMSWWQRDLRYAGASAFIALMVIFWTVPVAFVGFVSNINQLAKNPDDPMSKGFAFLSWIYAIPKPVLGVVTGLLPVVLLAVLMALVPIFCAFLAKFAGAASTAEVQLKTQNWYFWFQIVQVFLVTTLTSGAGAAIFTIISSPSSATSLLAQNLPKASNFYINYFVLQGIPIAAGLLINIAGFVIFLLLPRFLDNTPRKMFKRYLTLGGINWGASMPVMTNLGVIAITYSTIAPLVLGFASAGFFLIYLGYRHNVFYTLDCNTVNTQGRFYAKALQQLMAGVYLSEICLIGLFAISTGTGPVAAAALVLMIIFLVATLLVHSYLKSLLKPLTMSLPRDLLMENTRRMHHIEAGNNTSAPVTNGQHVDAVKPSNGVTSTVESDSPAFSNGEKALNGDRTRASPTAAPSTLKSGPKGWLFWLLHPTELPEFPPFFEAPYPEYPAEIRKEAYLDPAITSPMPLLWIAHDEMGISEMEVEKVSKVCGITDKGAWFDEKGNLTTPWVGEDERGEENLAREAPIYEVDHKY